MHRLSGLTVRRVTGYLLDIDVGKDLTGFEMYLYKNVWTARKDGHYFFKEITIFNPEDFRARKGDIIRHFNKKGVTDESIAEYCSLAGIPITVACTFIIEEFPEHEQECREKIRELRQFYGY